MLPSWSYEDLRDLRADDSTRRSAGKRWEQETEVQDSEEEMATRLVVSALHSILHMVCSDLNCYGESFRTFFGTAGFLAELEDSFLPSGLASKEAAQVGILSHQK